MIVLSTGILVHGLFTGRLPLVGAWIVGFILQAVIRAKMFGTPFFVPLMPMTSAAFIIFTLYMIPDPATTPLNRRHQALFGFAVAIVYGMLQLFHVVFGLFFALLIVCAARGLSLFVAAFWQGQAGDRVGGPNQPGGLAVAVSHATGSGTLIQPPPLHSGAVSGPNNRPTRQPGGIAVAACWSVRNWFGPVCRWPANSK